jgi:methionyl-tRNA formyltransferase
MKVLFLGNIGSPLIGILRSFGDDVVVCSSKLELDYLHAIQADFLVSYGYAFILSEGVLQLFHNKAINLHISYLPWNRGSDPDLWSLVDNTPKGVTIHFLDKGVDTGDIIAQNEVDCLNEETIGAYYNRLHKEIRVLFKEYWSIIKQGNAPRKKQEGKGSYHRSVDREKVVHLLKNRDDTLVKTLINYKL